VPCKIRHIFFCLRRVIRVGIRSCKSWCSDLLMLIVVSWRRVDTAHSRRLLHSAGPQVFGPNMRNRRRSHSSRVGYKVQQAQIFTVSLTTAPAASPITNGGMSRQSLKLMMLILHGVLGQTTAPLRATSWADLREVDEDFREETEMMSQHQASWMQSF
jgi:hypothetical protein